MNNNYKYTIKDVEDTADGIKTTVTNPLSGYEFADVDDICSSVIECIFDTVPNVQDTSIEFVARVAMNAIESVCTIVRASKGGANKWKAPNGLPAFAISEILEHTGECKVLLDDVKHPVLLIYNQYTGIWDMIESENDATIYNIISKCNKSLNSKQRMEVVTALKARLQFNTATIAHPTRTARYEAYNNCVWDYEEQKTIDFDTARSMGLLFTQKAAMTDYNEDADMSPIWVDEVNNRIMTVDEIVEEWLDNDEEKIEAFWIGCHAMTRPHCQGFQKSIVLVDTKKAGKNGKSQAGEMIASVIGTGNYSGATISDLNDAKNGGFNMQDLTHVSAIISTDAKEDDYIEDSKLFKQLATHDNIKVNQKYKEPITFRPYVQTWFTYNGFPRFRDDGDAISRRLYLIDFNKRFTATANPEIRAFLTSKEVSEYVLNKLVHMDIRAFKEFDFQKVLLGEFKAETNPIARFMDYITDAANRLDEEEHWDMYDFDFLYALYQDWYRNDNSGKDKGLVGRNGFQDGVRIWAGSNMNGWRVTAKKNEKVGLQTIQASKAYLEHHEIFIRDFRYERYSMLDKYINFAYSEKQVHNRYMGNDRKTRIRGVYKLTQDLIEEDKKQFDAYRKSLREGSDDNE